MPRSHRAWEASASGGYPFLVSGLGVVSPRCHPRSRRPLLELRPVRGTPRLQGTCDRGHGPPSRSPLSPERRARRLVEARDVDRRRLPPSRVAAIRLQQQTAASKGRLPAQVRSVAVVSRFAVDYFNTQTRPLRGPAGCHCHHASGEQNFSSRHGQVLGTVSLASDTAGVEKAKIPRGAVASRKGQGMGPRAMKGLAQADSIGEDRRCKRPHLARLSSGCE